MKLFYILLLSLSLSLISCSKAPLGLVNTSSGPNSNFTDIQINKNCSQYYQSEARVLEEKYISLPFYYTLSYVPFSTRVKDLVSTSFDSYDPTQFGTISGDYSNTNTGVSIVLKLKYDENKNITIASYIELVITDSLVGQDDGNGGIVAPFIIKIGGLQATQSVSEPTPSNSTGNSSGDFQKIDKVSGKINVQDNTFDVSFEDDFGTITIKGIYDLNNTRALVSFQNKVSFDNSTPKSGILGAFQLSNCVVFK